MGRRANRLVRRIALPAFVVVTSWLATARAEGSLDHGARFPISASPVASVLADLSTPGAIPTASGAGATHRTSNDVNGTSPTRVASSTVLHGADVQYSSVGGDTNAMPSASGGPPFDGVTYAGDSGATANVVMAQSTRREPDASAGAPM